MISYCCEEVVPFVLQYLDRNSSTRRKRLTLKDSNGPSVEVQSPIHECLTFHDLTRCIAPMLGAGYSWCTTKRSCIISDMQHSHDLSLSLPSPIQTINRLTIRCNFSLVIHLSTTQSIS